MRKVFLLLPTVLLMHLVSFAQSETINWQNPYYGSVNTIIETQYKLKDNAKTDTKSFSENDFLAFEEKLSIIDSSIMTFDTEEIILQCQTFCPDLTEDSEIIPCFITNQKHNKQHKWLGSEVINLIENNKIIYTPLTQTKEGLPIKSEAKDNTGQVIEYNYHEFNNKGFITKVAIEDLLHKDKFETTTTYQDDGYTMATYAMKYFAESRGKLQLEFQSEIKYKYLTFDKNGNWTKRRAIDEDGRISYSYRAYIYN